MNVLDRLLGHDLTTTRELLTICLSLSEEQMDREFDLGWRTLRRTFEHMIGNIEVWTDLMMERPIQQTYRGVTAAELLERLERSYAEFADFARLVERTGQLNERFTDVLDRPPRQKSFGGAIGHVITHNMHHRSEIMHMLHRLGVKDVPEGDLMGWDMRQRQSRRS